MAQLLDVSEIADATGREHPDVAIVGADGEQSHALELISAIVKQATCPVILDIESDDDSFLKNAARRGIFAYVKHGEQPGMEHAIDIVPSRYAEFNRLHGALRTGAIIEQAKGILMERHGITADQAFAELAAAPGTPTNPWSTWWPKRPRSATHFSNPGQPTPNEPPAGMIDLLRHLNR